MLRYPTAKSSLDPLLSRCLSSLSSLHGGSVSSSSCLQTLLKRGFSPTVEHLNGHLLFLSESRRFRSLVGFFPQFESNQIRPNSHSHSLLVRALLSLRRFDEAEDLMRKVPIFARSSMWDSLIQGYCVHWKNPDKGFSVLIDCFGKDGFLPSSYTFCSLIHAFSSLGMMEKAIEVLQLMCHEKINYPYGDFVCSSVISGFCKIGKPEYGVEFFYKAKNAGAFEPNLVTYTAVANALCQLGRVDDVCNLAIQMEKEKLGFDAVFFTCWMSGYLREGDLVEVLRKHKDMTDRHVMDDIISYTTMIDGFSKGLSVEKAGGLLAKMRKQGLEPNLITYTAIIFGFCRKGKLEEAVALFREIEGKGILLDEYIFATLIYGACQRGDYDFAYNLVEKMDKMEICPGVITYNIMINALCKVGRTSEAEEFSKGIFGDIITYTTLLNGYIGEANTEGISETKSRFAETGLRMDIVMCNVLMKASFLVGTFEDAYALYKGMEDYGVIPNAYTYCILIDGFCKAGRIDQALEVFDDFRSSAISSAMSYKCIINGLCERSMANVAMDVFLELIQKDLPVDPKVPVLLMKAAFAEGGAEGVLDLLSRIELLQPDIHSLMCNEAICLLCKRGFTDFACDVYQMTRRRSLTITSRSYYLILRGLIRLQHRQAYVNPLLGTFIRDHGIDDPAVRKIVVFWSCMTDVNTCLQFLKKMRKHNLVLTLPFAILKNLISDGRALDAYRLLVDAEDYLPNMDVVDFTIIIGGLCKRGYLDKALHFCSYARNRGISLNIIAYNMIIKGLCCQGRLVEAFRLYDSLEKIGLVPSEITYTTLIDVLCKERLMHEADKLFQAMVFRGYEPQVHVYNSLINGFCQIGLLEEALDTLQRLELKGLEVDGFTLSALINGYYLKGDMASAHGFYLEFKNRGILPDFLGFLYIVRGLSTKGRMEEARDVLRDMLRSQPIAEFINKVEGTELEDDSLYNVLVGFCEQGRIEDATILLNEIASLYFPARRSDGDINWLDKHNQEDIRTVEKVEDAMKNKNREPKFLDDFECFYSQVASLCSRGETQRANALLKSIIG